MIIKKKYENNWINYIFIVLAGLNIFQRGSLILLVFSLFNFFIIPPKKIKFDTTSLILCGFVLFASVSSFFYMELKVAFFEILKILNYLFLYILGKTGYSLAENKEKYLYRILFSMFLGILLQIFITYWYNMQLGGINGRILFSPWTKKAFAVTLMGLLSCVIIGFSFYGIFLSKKTSLKIFSVVSLILIFFINIQTATRTPFLLFIFVYFILIFNLLLKSKQKNREWGFLILIAFFVFALLVYFFDIFRLRSIIEESPLFDRLLEEGLETSRWEITATFFRYMLNHPWGGDHISTLINHSPHNIWQETYDRYGCFATFCILLVTIHIVKNIVKLINTKKINYLNYLTFGIAISILIQCALEPIITGFPIIFWFLLFIDGILTEKNKITSFTSL